MANANAKTYRCTIPDCADYAVKRVVLRTEEAVAAYNLASGKSIKVNSAAALCDSHVGHYVTGRRINRNDATVAVLDVVEKREIRDLRSKIAADEKFGLAAITADEVRQIVRSAASRRVADADAVYDSILDAFIARLGEFPERNGSRQPTAEERAKILRGACCAMADNGRHRATMGGERQHTVSLDALNTPTSTTSTWGSVDGLALSDLLADATDAPRAWQVGGMSVGEADMADLIAANPALWAEINK